MLQYNQKFAFWFLSGSLGDYGADLAQDGACGSATKELGIFSHSLTSFSLAFPICLLRMMVVIPLLGWCEA